MFEYNTTHFDCLISLIGLFNQVENLCVSPHCLPGMHKIMKGKVFLLSCLCHCICLISMCQTAVKGAGAEPGKKQPHPVTGLSDSIASRR